MQRAYSIILFPWLKEIGTSAFEGCTSLSSVQIPGRVSEIGDRAFMWCTALADLTFMDNPEGTRPRVSDWRKGVHVLHLSSGADHSRERDQNWTARGRRVQLLFALRFREPPSPSLLASARAARLLRRPFLARGSGSRGTRRFIAASCWRGSRFRDRLDLWAAARLRTSIPGLARDDVCIRANAFDPSTTPAALKAERRAARTNGMLKSCSDGPIRRIWRV